MSDPEHLEDSEDDDEEYCPKSKSSSGSSSEDDGDEEDKLDDKIEGNTKAEVSSNSLEVKPFDQNKTDELWKSFTSKPSSSSSSSSTTTTTTTTTQKEPTKTETKKVETKVLDFAGEKVSIATTNSNSAKRPATSILDRLGIGKKQKLSTLEKSRLDWQNHKESESLTEDLESHRRSKDSFVERKAFLERSELRQHDHFLSNLKKK